MVSFTQQKKKFFFSFFQMKSTELGGIWAPFPLWLETKCYGQFESRGSSKEWTLARVWGIEHAGHELQLFL